MSRRWVLGQRPYRGQLGGGVGLHQGRIAEMKTGEGKTLTAALNEHLRHVVHLSGFFPHTGNNQRGSGLVNQDGVHLVPGEGKTLTAALPAYLNALAGKGVHIVTVNDYLAKRDSEWMGKVYRFLGLRVGLIIHDLDPLAQYPYRRFPRGGEGLRQDIVQGFALLQPGLEFRCFRGQLRVGHGLVFRH